MPDLSCSQLLSHALGKTVKVNNSLLDELVKAWGLIDDLKADVARLEAGQRRFRCCACPAFVWVTDDVPPKGWKQFEGPNGEIQHACQDCTPGDRHVRIAAGGN
jgi:hypothetical protein